MLIERITANFTTSFNLYIDKIVTAIEKKLDHRLDCQSSEIFELNKKVESLERQNKALESSNTQLNDRINHMNTKMESLISSMDDLDQYSRNTNLLLHGVPMIPSQDGREPNLTQHVVGILNSNMGLSIQESEITTVHRIGKPQTISSALSSASHQGASLTRPAPLIIQFVSKKIRNETLSQRKNLKGKAISLTEQLTTRRAGLLKKCTDLLTQKKVNGAWSHDGRILIKTLNNRTLVVSNEQDLVNY